MSTLRLCLAVVLAAALVLPGSAHEDAVPALMKRSHITPEPTIPPAEDESDNTTVLLPALVIILGVGIPCGLILIWCTCTAQEPSKLEDPFAPDKFPDLEAYYYYDDYEYYPYYDDYYYYPDYQNYQDDYYYPYYYYYEEEGDTGLEEISEPEGYEYEVEYEDEEESQSQAEESSEDSGSSYEYEYELEEEEVEFEETVSEEVSYEEEEEEESEGEEDKVFIRVLWGDSYKVIPVTPGMTLTQVIGAFSQKLAKPLAKGPDNYYLELVQADGTLQKLNSSSTVGEFGLEGMAVAHLRKK